MSTLDTDLNDKDIEDLFGDFDPREYEKETKERWGKTDAYAESTRRTSKYNKADWERIKAEADANNAHLAKLFAEGRATDDPELLAAIDARRGHITKNFYDCSLEIYEGLADMYVCDARFTKNLDKIAPGFAQNLHDAMKKYVEIERTK